MPSTFAQAVDYNDLGTITVAFPHAADADTLVLSAALPPLGAGRIYRVTAVTNPGTVDEVVLGVFEATGLVGGTMLTGVTGPSIALAVGVAIEVRDAAENHEEHSAAINALEAAGGNSRLVYDVRDYGAVGDDATDDRAAIQAALDAAAASGHGGKVFVPAGQYRVSAPLRIHSSCTSFVGEASGRFEEGTRIAPTGGWFPVLYIAPPGAVAPDLTFGAALVGSGSSLAVSGGGGQSTATWIDFRDAAAMDLDGLGAFTAECFFRQTALPQGYLAYLLACGGRRSANDPVHTTCDLRVDQNRAASAHLNIGGTVYTLGSAGALVLDNTTYHIALTYDGTTIRLFLGVAGGAAAMVASQAATGTIVQTPSENGSIGPYRQDWPRGGVFNGTIDGRIDSVRFSSVARYTAPYTAPNAKLTNAAGTLLLENWDDETPDFSIVATAYGPAWLPKCYQLTGDTGLLARVEVGNLALTGGQGAGLRATATVESYFHDLMITGGVWGIDLDSTCYLSNLERIKVASNGPWCRVGIAAIGVAGVSNFDGISIESFDYGLVCQSAGGGTLRGCFINGNRRVGILLQNSTFVLDGVSLSEEDVTDPKVEAGLWVSDGVAVTVRGSTFECYAFPHPAVVVDGGDVLTLDTVAVELHASATEAIRVLSPTAHPPVLVNPSFGRPFFPRDIPWSTGAFSQWDGTTLLLTAAGGGFTLRPGTRTYAFGCNDPAGSLTFTRSDVANGLSLIPSASDVALTTSATGATVVLRGQAQSPTPGIALSPFDGGGTGLLQIGRRLSDSNPACGASVEIWTNTGQTLPAWVIKAPGGGSTLAAFGPDGSLGIGTPTPFAPLSFGGAIGEKIRLYEGFGDYGLGVRTGELAIFAGIGGGVTLSTDGLAGTVVAAFGPTAITLGGGGSPFKGLLSAVATLDFPSVAAAGQQELTISVTGAAAGDTVHLGRPAGLEAGLVATARVTAADTVTVRVSNLTAAPIDPASASWRATVVKF